MDPEAFAVRMQAAYDAYSSGQGTAGAGRQSAAARAHWRAHWEAHWDAFLARRREQRARSEAAREQGLASQARYRIW